MPTGNWGYLGPVEIYGKKYKLEQCVSGPCSFGMDASLFKTVPLTERMLLRFNADFFGLLNNPGTPMPSESSGIISMQNSSNSPRELQLTLRLSW